MIHHKGRGLHKEQDAQLAEGLLLHVCLRQPKREGEDLTSKKDCRWLTEQSLAVESLACTTTEWAPCGLASTQETSLDLHPPCSDGTRDRDVLAEKVRATSWRTVRSEHRHRTLLQYVRTIQYPSTCDRSLYSISWDCKGSRTALLQPGTSTRGNLFAGGPSEAVRAYCSGALYDDHQLFREVPFTDSISIDRAGRLPSMSLFLRDITMEGHLAEDCGMFRQSARVCSGSRAFPALAPGITSQLMWR